MYRYNNSTLYTNNSHNNNNSNSCINNSNGSHHSIGLDPNYEILKREFNNIYNNTLKINDSVIDYCNKIKDVYLNPYNKNNNFLNGLIKSFNNSSISSNNSSNNNRYNNNSSNNNNNNNQHPLSIYSSNIKNQSEIIINEWLINQESNLNSILNYCEVLKIIKLNIESLDKLELNLINSTPNQLLQKQREYINEKSGLFNDVKGVFNDRINSFDIPLINFQFSIQSLYSSLGATYSNSTHLLDYDLPKCNPIEHLAPNNNQLIYQQQSYNPQQQQQRPVSTSYSNIPIDNTSHFPPSYRPSPIPPQNNNNSSNSNNNISTTFIPSVQTQSNVNNKPSIFKPSSSHIYNPQQHSQHSNNNSTQYNQQQQLQQNNNQQYNSNNNLQPVHLSYSKIWFNYMPIKKILNREIVSQHPNNSFYIYDKFESPIPKPPRVEDGQPSIDNVLNDYELHKRMWQRRWRVNRKYKFSFIYTAKRSWSIKGKLESFTILMHKPQSMQTQHIHSSRFELHCETSGRIIRAVEIPTNLYPCFKIEYKDVPLNAKLTMYHITEADMFSNALEEVGKDEHVEYTPITEQEIFIYTNADQLCCHDKPEFEHFIKKHQLEPKVFPDGTKESIISFCYRVSLFIKKHMVYSQSHGTQKALTCMETGKGACGSFSTFFSSITRYNNIPTRYISGRSIHEKKFARDSTGKLLAPCGCHSQIEFYAYGLWIPYNGAFCTNDVYNRGAFGQNNGATYIQQLNLTTDTEYCADGVYHSLTNPKINHKWDSSSKSNDLGKPEEFYEMIITKQNK